MPACLQGLLRFRLYETLGDGSETAATMRLEFEIDEHRRLIHSTCGQLASQVNLVSKSKPVPIADARHAVSPSAAAASQQSIFLADVTDDLEFERQELRHHLTNLGHRVLPDQDEFFDSSSEECEQKLTECLENSDAYVQLLSDVSGRVLRRIDTTYAEFQYKKATNQGLRIYQWRSKKIARSDSFNNVWTEKYQDLLFGKDVNAMNLEEFKSFLDRKLRGIPTNQNKQPGILIRYDDAERSGIANLQQSLNDQGFMTQLFRFSEAVGEMIQDSSAVLTYCNDETPSVRKAIWEMRDICFGSGKPVLPCLYMVPPPADRIPPAGFDGMFATTSLDDFVSRLKTQKPR